MVVGIDRGAGEALIIIEALSEAEALQKEYRDGNTVTSLAWYQKPAPA